MVQLKALVVVVVVVVGHPMLWCWQHHFRFTSGHASCSFPGSVAQRYVCAPTASEGQESSRSHLEQLTQSCFTL